jgi:hypothetical protein
LEELQRLAINRNFVTAGRVAVDKITGRDDVIDMQLLPSKPGRFESVANRVHTLRRRNGTMLLVV